MKNNRNFFYKDFHIPMDTFFLHKVSIRTNKNLGMKHFQVKIFYYFPKKNVTCSISL